MIDDLYSARVLALAANMPRAGRLAAETLDMITPHVRAGVTTGELDAIIHDFTVANDAVPATLNYRGQGLSAAPRLDPAGVRGGGGRGAPRLYRTCDKHLRQNELRIPP